MQIASGSARLEVESFGEPRNPALVLVMGATASMLWWPEVLCRSLAEAGLFVLRFDNRDTGQSTNWPPGAPGYAVEDMADDILAVMDGLGLAMGHVMGMSLGGYVAQMAALRAPERVRSLVLLGCEPLGWSGPELPGISDRFMAHFAGFAALDWSDADAVVAFRLEIARLCAGSAHPFEPEVVGAMLAKDYARSASPASAFNHGMLDMREDWTDGAARLSLPVLVLHGEKDPILPLANGQALARTIEGARLVVLEKAGHEIALRDVPRMVTELVGFLRKVEGEA